MDLRHMRHFVVVAEELHFGKAARRLHMSQPPLSQSIRRLEVDLGVDLFDRSRRGVALTAAGRVFLTEARSTIMQADLARKLAQRAAMKLPEVRVSFIGPALYRLLPELIVRYRAAHPGVHVRLFERSTPEQFTGMLAGDFDAGFVTTAIARPNGCETLLVERAPLVAAVPADWPLAQGTSVSLAELAEHTFIIPPARYATPFSEPLSMFKAAGVMPEVTQEAMQTNTTIGLVSAGVGCGLVMKTAALMQSRNIRYLPLRDDVPRPPWEMMMAWLPEHLSKPALDFVRVTQNYLHDNPKLIDPDANID